MVCDRQVQDRERDQPDVLLGLLGHDPEEAVQVNPDPFNLAKYGVNGFCLLFAIPATKTGLDELNCRSQRPLLASFPVKALVLSLFITLVPLGSRACEVALVVALDVSRSVDKFEYVLMRNGIGHAFLDDDIIRLISWMPGGMQVTVTQWGGSGQQRQPIAWRRLSNRESVIEFVEDLITINRGFWMAETSVSEALLHADLMFHQLENPCRRQVIDVSGDGISNAGPEAKPISDTIATRGITINGLVVAGARPDPVVYYLSEVVRGPLSFVEVTHSYDDYDQAMKRKLLRELTPNLSRLE